MRVFNKCSDSSPLQPAPARPRVKDVVGRVFRVLKSKSAADNDIVMVGCRAEGLSYGRYYSVSLLTGTTELLGDHNGDQTVDASWEELPNAAFVLEKS